MTMKKIVAVSLIAIALTGCATTPIPSTMAKPAPPDRLLAFQMKPSEPFGTLTITRDVGHIGSACFYAISINGTLAARLDVAEKATFYVTPGEVLLRSGSDLYGKGLCSHDKNVWTQRETQLKPGETKYFRMSIDENGKTDIQRSDP